MADKDLPALDLTRGGVIRTGRRILRELAAGIALIAPSSEPIHRQLAAAWGLDAARADILRRCLVLIADHELNASTFVARCVASTGATPYAVVAGWLARGEGLPAFGHFLYPEGDPRAAAILDAVARVLPETRALIAAAD